ncbi:hypothetical protein PENSPDRAFT_688377 [Peniophora sp. CONT]|nr:hypothetical protein PENSPDRAFT_688377 [Peniophora sp. CONT]
MASMLPPIDIPPVLSAESSASTDASGNSQPATPADDEHFEHGLDIFATPRKARTDGKMMLFDERASRLLREAVEAAGLAQGTDMNLVRDISSTSAGGSFEDSMLLQPSNSPSGHQILVRSPTGETDNTSPSLSPDMPSLGRSQTLYRQPNVTFGLTPLLGTLPSSSSLAGNISHAGFSESNTTSSLSLASAPDSMLAIISARSDPEVDVEARTPFPDINIGTPDPQFMDRSLTAEGYEGDSDREDEESSLGPGDDYADTLVSSASELDCAGLTTLIMRGTQSSSSATDLVALDLSEPFAPIEQHGSLFPLLLARDLALTPIRLAILGAAQLLHPTLLPFLLFGSSHLLWPRAPSPLGGILRLEAYAHALQGAGFAFLFVLLLSWQLGGPIGRAITLAALTRAAWVWCAFELDIDRAMAQSEDVACAWAVLFSKEREVVGWMAQRARMEMDGGGASGEKATSVEL